MRSLYVFEPSEDWNYCGGALGIIAGSFEEARDIYTVDHKDDAYSHYGLFRTQAEVPNESYGYVDGNEVLGQPSGYGGQGWVLTHTLSLDPECQEPSRVLFFNYNYA